MQAPLAIIGFVLGILAWWQTGIVGLAATLMFILALQS
jgi:hypothetical protein